MTEVSVQTSIFYCFTLNKISLCLIDLPDKNSNLPHKQKPPHFLSTQNDEK